MTIENICPKCQIVMKPVDENENVFYRCVNCGYSIEFKGWTDRECPSCHYNKMTLEYYGIIIGDEQPLAMYKCLKCGAVEREGFS